VIDDQLMDVVEQRDQLDRARVEEGAEARYQWPKRAHHFRVGRQQVGQERMVRGEGGRRLKVEIRVVVGVVAKVV